MSGKLKIGVAGAAGWMAGALAAGAEYDENGYSLEAGSGVKSGNSVVTALCDLNMEAMEKRKAELKLDSAELFISYDEMLASDNVAAVIVAVPNRLHADFAVKALEAGKHLFLEKPFATTREDPARLAAAVAKSPKTTKIDYIILHYDEQENLKKLISEGAFGEIASVFFTYRHPINLSESADQKWKLSGEKSGGAIPMGICHALAATVYQVASDPVSVTCIGSPARSRNFDYCTQQDMMIKFANGVVGIVQGNIDFAESYDARHTIIGTGGQFDYMPFNPLESRVMWSSKAKGRKYAADPAFANDHLDSGNVWKHKCGRTIKAFIEHAIKGDKDPLLGLESSMVKRVETIIWASQESTRNGGALVRI